MAAVEVSAAVALVAAVRVTELAARVLWVVTMATVAEAAEEAATVAAALAEAATAAPMVAAAAAAAGTQLALLVAVTVVAPLVVAATATVPAVAAGMAAVAQAAEATVVVEMVEAEMVAHQAVAVAVMGLRLDWMGAVMVLELPAVVAKGWGRWETAAKVEETPAVAETVAVGAEAMVQGRTAWG